MKKAEKLTRLEEKILQLIYGYESDIECNGVVFSRLEEIDKKAFKLRSIVAEPLYVTEDGDTDSVYFGYYAAVVEDNLEMTDTQLRETLAVLEQKNYIKRFSLSKWEGRDTYRVEECDSDTDDEEIQGDAFAYMLTQKAIDCLHMDE